MKLTCKLDKLHAKLQETVQNYTSACGILKYNIVEIVAKVLERQFVKPDRCEDRKCW